MSIDRTLYVIRNTKVRPPYDSSRPRLLSLMRRSISVLIAYQGIGDLYRISTKAKRDGIDFHLASIPDSWTREPEEAFDTRYMIALFDLGEEIGRSGTGWRETPLSIDPKTE